MAKAPIAGRAKTRLSPPCTAQEAATLAAACLADTLAAVAATGQAAWWVVALDGDPAQWLPPGTAAISQRGRSLDERLAAVMDDIAPSGPALVIGMDTPQVTPALLDACLDTLAQPGVDATLGPAVDGGWWALGLNRPDGRAFCGVPMSRATTAAHQRRRLQELELVVAELPVLRDVDVMADVWAVAEQAPATRFAAALAALGASAARPSTR